MELYVLVSVVLDYRRRRLKTEEKAAVWGKKFIQILAALVAIFHQDDLRKKMNRITATWRNGKVDNHPVYNIPNHHPTKMDVFPRTLAQIIFAAKWLVQHSSRVHMSPNQQQRPLPSLLSLSFFYSRYYSRLRQAVQNAIFKYNEAGLRVRV